MGGYTKIFESLLDSTVWALSKEARLLWITMLVKKDREQVVRASVPGLAHAARLTLEETESALVELQKPDAYSQSQEHEGRRILPAEQGGWMVVNGAKYRDMISVEARREYQAQWARDNRAKRRVDGPTAREQRYVAATKRGASEEELGKIAAEGLPKGGRKRAK